MQSSFAEFTCDGNMDYVAQYEPNTYTCNPGYFLPANVDGCQPCPSGYTCNGGTFTFNSNYSSGISVGGLYPGTSANNVCADNFPTDFYAVYEPNTMNLVWVSDNGETSNTTCTYGGGINLPEPPIRTGYTFTGWKVVNVDN